MRENVLGLPALQIEPGARRQELETGFRKLAAALARNHHVELFAQAVQMQHVGGGIGELRFAQRICAPVARLLLLLQIDIEHLAHQILQAVAVGIGARQPRGDLGAIDRLRHHAEGVIKRGKIEAREVEDLHDFGIG